jgi:hypothetical protein
MAIRDSAHQATIDWTRGKWPDAKGKYSREHTWHLAGGGKLKASDAGALLPDGYRDKAQFNPENLFVATVASTHMIERTTLHFRDWRYLTGERREMLVRHRARYDQFLRQLIEGCVQDGGHRSVVGSQAYLVVRHRRHQLGCRLVPPRGSRLGGVNRGGLHHARNVGYFGFRNSTFATKYGIAGKEIARAAWVGQAAR